MTLLYPPYGTSTLALTLPASAAWILRLSSYQQAGTSVAIEATVSVGTQQTIAEVSPAQASYYAGNLFPWTPAAILGEVGISPFGTPTGWTDAGAWWLGPDAAATSGDMPGKWLLRKWLLVTSTQTYTVSMVADNEAVLYVDGTQILTSTSSTTTAKASVSLAAGYHLLTVDATNYGTAASATGVLLSIADPSGNVIEDGSDASWQTSGYIGNPWSYSAGAPLFEHSWYVIDQPASTSLDLVITLIGDSSTTPQVNHVWWYAVPVWRWDKGGEYNATPVSTLPVSAQVTEVLG